MDRDPRQPDHFDLPSDEDTAPEGPLEAMISDNSPLETAEPPQSHGKVPGDRSSATDDDLHLADDDRNASENGSALPLA